jgi:nitrogenase-associated protein
MMTRQDIGRILWDGAMRKIIFYEKPDCAENRKQKETIAASGYDIETRDLTAHHWTPAGLRAFFADKPVADWFDPRAAKVLSGEVNPAAVTPQAALVMMSIDPNLIRSPLIKFNGRCASGLDAEELEHFLVAKKRDGSLRPGVKPPEHWTGE